MAWTTAVAIYFLIWWITLFAVLPFGVRSQHEDGAFDEGTDPGAPVKARIWIKLLWTTIVASVIFAALATVYHYRLVTMDDLFHLFGADRLTR
jgi:predicted secreted protein